MARLAAVEPREHEFHGLTFVSSMSATTVDFRGARNVIPDRFVVNVNYRFRRGARLRVGYQNTRFPDASQLNGELYAVQLQVWTN